MKTATGRFLLRWFVCGLGLWISAALLGSGGLTYGNSLGPLILSGLILAAVNSIIKPIVVILSLPAILFSLGLFMIVINGLMVWLVSALYSPLHVKNFWAAMAAGFVIGFVNYLVTTILDSHNNSTQAPA